MDGTPKGADRYDGDYLMSAGSGTKGVALLANGDRLLVENISELRAAVHDQRQTWVEARVVGAPRIDVRTSAIIGFTKAPNQARKSGRHDRVESANAGATPAVVAS